MLSGVGEGRLKRKRIGEKRICDFGYLLPSRPEGSLSTTLNDDRWSLFDPKRPSTIVFAPKGRAM
ncbi:hypothetical protein CAJAP_00951 [Camponotus japonicus]